MNRKTWNDTIDKRRASGQVPFKKGDFTATSPDYSLPNDVYAHPTVQEAEGFFEDQRARNSDLSPKQLMELNKIQNEMRDKLSGFSCMYNKSTYESALPMRDYVEQAKSVTPPPEVGANSKLGWQIVHIAVTEYLNRAKKVVE